MRNVLLVLFVFVGVSLWGQDPEFEWVAGQGGVATDWGETIATDTFGNVYNAGRFENHQSLTDTADFDPGPGFYGLYSKGEGDVFVSKLSTEGELIWAVSFGGIENDGVRDICTDDSGNIYITGSFKGYVDFDPGLGDYSIYTLNRAIFVLKLNTNGNFMWARKLGGTEAALTTGDGIMVDSQGNVYTVGTTDNGSDFDPGPGEYILTVGGDDNIAFISKLDSEGNFIWAKGIGSLGAEGIFDIAIDQSDNLYLTGYLQGTADFDPGSGEFILSATGLNDLFVLKLDNGGDFIWVKHMQGNAVDYNRITGQGIAVDDMYNIYITGGLRGTVDFDPGAGIYELSTVNADIVEQKAFVLKLDENGDFVWAKKTGGTGTNDFAFDIALDKNNNACITGTFEDSVDFDPGEEIFSLYAINYDAFVLGLDQEGNFSWAISFPTSDTMLTNGSRGRSIAIDRWNNIYTTGSVLRDNSDFDPDTSSVYYLSTNGGTDIFTHKMRQPCSVEVASSSPNICWGDSVLLEPELTFLPGIQVDYQWNTGDSSETIVVVPDSSSQYFLNVIYVDNDLSCVTSDTVEINVLSLPDLPIIPSSLVIVDNQASFEITIPEVLGATAYSWAVPSGVEILSGTGTNTIVVDWNEWGVDGIICVSAINECGSSATACMEVIVDTTNTIEKVEKERVVVFPNPVSGILNIIFITPKYRTLILLDSSAKIYNQQEMTNEKSTINISDLPSGIYWLKIIEDGRVFWEKIVVE